MSGGQGSLMVSLRPAPGVSGGRGSLIVSLRHAPGVSVVEVV